MGAQAAQEEERKKKRAAARRKQQQQPTEDEKLGELPPHLKAAYARLQMAQASSKGSGKSQLQGANHKAATVQAMLGCQDGAFHRRAPWACFPSPPLL